MPIKRTQVRFEFPIKSSPGILYNYLSTPSGLSEWFCDDVNIRNGIYSFFWDKEKQEATQIKSVNNKLVRFHWVDTEENEYFEFEIVQDELTDDVALVVTDFVDETDVENSRLLWEAQFFKLKESLGG